jgi:hypothetical protein
MWQTTSRRLAWLAMIVPVLLAPATASARGTKAPKDARVYIITPNDGETVTGAFWCRFGLRNMGVTHAGDDFAGTGHHHLLIDVDETFEAGQEIPRDKKHIHYAAGETEARLELSPGKHTLQLVVGDSRHLHFDPPIASEKIMITVARPNASEEQARVSRNTGGRRAILERAAPGEPQQLHPEVTPEMTKSPESSDFISRVLTGTK